MPGSVSLVLRSVVGDVIGRGVEMVNIVRVVAGHMQYVIADKEEGKDWKKNRK